jgi:hypothetical protein
MGRFIVIIVMSGGRVKIPCHLLAYVYSYKILNFSGEGGGSRTFVRKIIFPIYSNCVRVTLSALKLVAF